MRITFDKDYGQAEAHEGDKKIGYCQFEPEEDGVWAITHTVVDPEFGGQGIAAKLVDEVVKNAREEGVKISPICSYAAKRFDEKPEEYSDVDARL